ncbi:MAG: hypothetical protein AAF991_08395, partial [Pseudomonadota bacterium]
ELFFHFLLPHQLAWSLQLVGFADVLRRFVLSRRSFEFTFLERVTGSVQYITINNIHKRKM